MPSTKTHHVNSFLVVLFSLILFLTTSFLPQITNSQAFAIQPDAKKSSIEKADEKSDQPEESDLSEEKEKSEESKEESKASKKLHPIEKAIDNFAGQLVGLIASVFFFNILSPFPGGYNLPFAVAWLVFGAIFFTLRMGFINIRAFKHAILVTMGKYDSEDDHGEVSHFQALTSALSATVGLGNIAGVAIAVSVGGPGATFWMIIAGFLGMSSKFAECTLGQKYRTVRPDGSIMGGAMHYLSRGLAEIKMAPLGKFLAAFFAILCIGGSFGGGNAFQVNQSLNALKSTFPVIEDYNWLYGLAMSALVGIVIIGGIQRIAKTAEKIVPVMCGVYVVACLWILGNHAGEIRGAFGLIVSSAFSFEAGLGGFIGVIVTGFKRAAFSNEAGIGSAPIAHSAAKTDYPVREGIVALLEPFIDTIVVCTMTALVIIITGAYDNPDANFAEMRASSNGAGLTVEAMRSEIDWFPYVLSGAVVLFAYSTMISWSYYGERCWVYLFGDRSSLYYKIVFLIVTFLGSIVSATNILDLSDLMILGMAIPNLIGVILLSGIVKRELDTYWKMYKSNNFQSKEIDPDTVSDS